MPGFHHPALADVPKWASHLNNCYYRIRVEGPSMGLRRKYYRMVRVEKLRLLESGVEIELIYSVCKYLVSFKQINADRINTALKS